MVLDVCAALVAVMLGLWLVARVTRDVAARLGIDWRAALLWLGLAEERVTAPPRRPRSRAATDL